MGIFDLIYDMLGERRSEMIILFGAAGSGKSSQGRILAEQYGMCWLSVGQVIRDTGEFEAVTKRGELVDTEVVVELMRKEMARAEAEGEEVILDGYPRDVDQAEILQKDGTMKKISLAIILKVPKAELLKRLEQRGRKDDKEEVIRRRFEIFEENIEGIKKRLMESGVKVVELDGVGKFEEVTERIVAKIREELPDERLARMKRPAGKGEREQSYGE